MVRALLLFSQGYKTLTALHVHFFFMCCGCKFRYVYLHVGYIYHMGLYLGMFLSTNLKINCDFIV